MTLTDPAVREAFAALGQTLARQKAILDAAQSSFGPQDIDATRADYVRGISKVKP